MVIGYTCTGISKRMKLLWEGKAAGKKKGIIFSFLVLL